MGESWDVVISDPPAFAKKRADVDRAARGYKDVNRLAMALVAPGGWLLTCSCSGLVDADLFQKIVFAASTDARRSFSIAARQGAGPDHPVSIDCPGGRIPEGTLDAPGDLRACRLSSSRPPIRVILSDSEGSRPRQTDEPFLGMTTRLSILTP